MQKEPYVGRHNLTDSIQKLFQTFSRFKIMINPYIVFYEELKGGMTIPKVITNADKIRIYFLNKENMKAIASFPGRAITTGELMERLNNHKICIGLNLDQDLVAFTWFDLKESNIKGIKRPLNDDEAYLFDAYTSPAYRGRNLAPFMRYAAYQELKKIGKDKLISFSDYFNSPAIRFKEKLKAKPIEVRINIRFLVFSIDMKLKNYLKTKSCLNSFHLRVRYKGNKVIKTF